jgi:hypothetical protein
MGEMSLAGAFDHVVPAARSSDVSQKDIAARHRGLEELLRLQRGVLAHVCR